MKAEEESALRERAPRPPADPRPWDATLERIAAHRLFPWVFWALVAATLLHAFDRRPRMHWHYAKDFWRFSYELEFLKRALPGEIYRHAGLPLEADILFGISLGFALLLVFAILALARRLLRDSGWAPGIALFLFMALSHSTFLPARLNDFARFDVLLFLLALLPLPLLSSRRDKFFLIAATLVGLLSLLVHEAAFLMFLPGLLACWVAQAPGRERLAVAFGLLLLLGMAGVWIQRYGAISPALMEAHLDILARGDAGLDGGVNGWVLFVYRPEGLVENMLHTAHVISLPVRGKHHLIFAVGILPTLLLLWQGRSLGHHIGTGAPAIGIAALVLLPLALYPFGHDHFRWWNMAFSNSLLLLLVMAIHRPALREDLDCFMRAQLPLAILIVATSFLLGAAGFTYSFRIAYGL